MKNFISLIAFILLPMAMSAATATQILAESARALNSAPSLTIAYTVSQGSERSNGTLTVARDKFVLSSPEVKVWYDGSTQWTLQTQGSVLSITEPTADELLESNPFALLNHYDKAYNCKSLASQGKDPVVELTAKSKYNPIRKAVLTINAATKLPSKLVVTMNNGNVMTATVTKTTVGKVVPSSTFVYNKKLNPAREINDLR